MRVSSPLAKVCVRVFLSIFASVLLIGACCGCPARRPPASGRVVLALPLQPSSALALIADSEGFFSDEGLDLVTTNHPSGKRALRGMLAGGADIATTAEVPAVFAHFERSDFSVVAVVGLTAGIPKIVGRRDAGIESESDLRGKRIGTQRGSAVHFFLHLFLVKNGMADDDVEVVYLKAEELAPALVEGTIDAFSMREPYVTHARESLGDGIVIFDSKGIYAYTELLVARKAFAQEHPDAIKRVLRALVRAEQYAHDHPADAARTLAHALGVPVQRIEDVWPNLDPTVQLYQSLLLNLEDEARWALSSGLVEADHIPNFLDLISVDCLSSVRPEAVTVISLGSTQ